MSHHNLLEMLNRKRIHKKQVDERFTNKEQILLFQTPSLYLYRNARLHDMALDGATLCVQRISRRSKIFGGRETPCCGKLNLTLVVMIKSVK